MADHNVFFHICSGVYFSNQKANLELTSHMLVAYGQPLCVIILFILGVKHEWTLLLGPEHLVCSFYWSSANSWGQSQKRRSMTSNRAFARMDIARFFLTFLNVRLKRHLQWNIPHILGECVMSFGGVQMPRHQADHPNWVKNDHGQNTLQTSDLAHHLVNLFQAFTLK